jgi:threonine synthase
MRLRPVAQHSGARRIGIFPIRFADGPVDTGGERIDALRIVRELGETGQVEVVNSINPVRIEGQKTAAFEVVDQLGQAPDFHFLPVGNAGNITAYWKGYNEYRAAGLAKAVPRMFGFQAANAAPLVEGRPIKNPQTVATAIRIGNPASWDGAMNALKESNGHIAKVTDEEILAAYKLAARTEGVFAEPASAASLAGLIHCVRDGLIPGGSKIVATLTGHGLKDPDNAISVAGLEPTVVAPETDAVKRVIGL